ncbi:MAG: NADH-quinone oxidoreductase subunit J [Anaerolineae bacterium]|jgi:NADH-quinone oxidoreductase subunit J|nr:NADH-quinone oxidoreductase subunit J [Anaerolineae bacterium]
MNVFLTSIFVIVSVITLVGALGVVMARTVFASGLWLILSFAGVAGLYVLLEAPFLAAAQILIYVGAVAVLILFAVMLTRRVMGDPGVSQNNSQWGAAAVVAALMFIVLSLTSVQNWRPSTESPPLLAVNALGEAFLGPYLLPFEIVSVVLLVALVGAIILARE